MKPTHAFTAAVALVSCTSAAYLPQHHTPDWLEASKAQELSSDVNAGPSGSIWQNSRQGSARDGHLSRRFISGFINIDCTGDFQDMSPAHQRFCTSCTGPALYGVRARKCFELHRQIEREETHESQPLEGTHVEQRDTTAEADLSKNPKGEEPVTYIPVWDDICTGISPVDVSPARIQYCVSCKDPSLSSALETTCDELYDKIMDEETEACPTARTPSNNATLPSRCI